MEGGRETVRYTEEEEEEEVKPPLLPFISLL